MKKHLILLLKTLISNNACVEAARTKEIKYNIIAIALGIVSVFLAILPISINAFKKSGTDWLSSSTNCAIDLGMYKFSEAAQESGNEITFTVKYDSSLKRNILVGNGINNNDKWIHHDPAKVGTQDHFQKKDDQNRLHCYSYKNPNPGNDFYTFEVYDFTEFDNTKLAKYATHLVNNLNPYLKEDGKKDEESYLDYTTKDNKDTKFGRDASFIAFGKTSFYAFMYNPATRSSVSSTIGDYDNMNKWRDVDIVSKFFVSGKEITPQAKIDNTFKNWKEFFNIAYTNTRWNNGWKSTGVMIGVDFGVLIFMGAMVFILTRGKNNPFRIYSFWDGQKIAYYASFTPGIIALIGFAIPNMAMMFYVLCLGVRVMWLSMRTLKYQAPAKQ